VKLLENELMKGNPILGEIWRIKDELSREMAANPDAYFAKLDKMTKAEEKSGRKVIRSAEELRQLVAQKERQRAVEQSLILNDKPPRKA
jgi:hypothetical protein